MAVVLGKLLASYLYHIGSQMVLVLIHQVLDGSYLVGLFLVIGVRSSMAFKKPSLAVWAIWMVTRRHCSTA